MSGMDQQVARTELDLLRRQFEAIKREIVVLKNQHTPTVPIYEPDLPDDAVEAQHAFRASRPRYYINGLWEPRLMYVTPVAPADTPDDYDEQGEDGYPEWEDPWVNISPDFEPTAFTNFFGHLWLRICGTGGEGTPNSLMFTLPSTHWPAKKKRLFGQAGLTGDRIASIEVHVNGEVEFLTSIALT